MRTFDLVSVASEAGILLSFDGSFRLKDGSTISADSLQKLAKSAIAAERRELCLQLAAEMKPEDAGTTSKWHNKAIKQCISVIRNR